jgi:chromosome condensin MukBEF MukE localization factor
VVLISCTQHDNHGVFAQYEQYSDVVSDLTTDKALLLVNRRLAKAEEHNRQMTAQLRAKNEKLDDLAKLNVELQDLLKIKVWGIYLTCLFRCPRNQTM